MADINQLIQQLGESRTTIAATQALVDMGTSAVEALLAAMHNANEMTRRQAAQALVKIGDPRAAPALMEQTDDPLMAVRINAVNLLGTMTADPRIPDILLQIVRDIQRPSDTRTTAVFALGRLQGQAAAHVLWLELLNDSVPEVVMNAAMQLGNSKQPEVVDPLIDTLNRLGNAHGAFGFIVVALGKLGDKRAFEPIAAHLNAADPVKRGGAVEALKALGDPRALDLLEPLQRDNGIAWEEDHGPKITVGQAARDAIAVIRKANGLEPQKPRWKFW